MLYCYAKPLAASSVIFSILGQRLSVQVLRGVIVWAIEAGKAADLVLLEADPAEDISNTAKIFAVIRGGQLLDRPGLDAMLRKAESSAKAVPPKK